MAYLLSNFHSSTIHFAMNFKAIIYFHSILMKFRHFHEFWYETGVKLNQNRGNINSNIKLMLSIFGIQIFTIISLILVNICNLYLKYTDFHSHFFRSNIVVKDQREVKLFEILIYLTQFLAYTLKLVFA